MVSKEIIIFSILAAYKIGDVLSLMCKACEGEMCNAYQMNVRCEFPARQCMRLSEPNSGRVFKMGCVYPYDEICQRQQFNEQIRCYTCEYDNCNAISSAYSPSAEISPYSNGHYGPYSNPQRYGPNGRYGYYWNGGKRQQNVNVLVALTVMLTVVLVVF